MNINDPRFKVSTVVSSGTHLSDPVGRAETVSSSETAGFELDIPEADVSELRSGDPLDNYFWSEASGGDDSILLALENFPPSINESRIGSGENPVPLSVLLGKYEVTIQKLEQFKNEYLTILQSGQLAPQEVRAVQHRIDLFQQASTRAEGYKLSCQELIATEQETYRRELATWTDMNGDKIIGDPLYPESAYGMKERENGEVVLYNLKTGAVISTPTIFDPSYDPGLFQGALTLETVNESGSDAEVDLELQLTSDERIMAEPPMQVIIPQYIWAKKSEDGRGFEYDDNGDLIFYNSFEDGRQLPPEDMTMWGAARIDEFKVESVASHVAADGTQLWNDRVRLFTYIDGMPVEVLSMEMKGYFGDSPAAAHLDDGRKYVSTSSVGFKMVREGISSVIGNAEERISTGRYRHDDFLASVGLDGQEAADPTWSYDHEDHALSAQSSGSLQGEYRPPEAGDVFDHAFRETTGLFEGRDISAWSHGRSRSESEDATSPYRYSATPQHHLVYEGDRYGGSHNVYISDQEVSDIQNDVQNTVGTPRGGIIFDGFTGHLTGSKGNNVFIQRDLESLSEKIRGMLPPDYEGPKPRDPQYATMIFGNGHDAVIGAAGASLYIRGATFVWKENGNDDTTFIETTAGFDLDNQGMQNPLRNPKHYIHVSGGGEVKINNKDETNEIESQHFDEDSGISTVNFTYYDDAYDINVANAMFGDPLDPDVPDRFRVNGQGEAFDETFDAPWNETETALRNSIEQMNDDELDEIEAEIEQEIAAGGPNYQETAAELDSFFGEAFGWEESAQAEIEMLRNGGV